MLFYLFLADTSRLLFARVSYPFEHETIPRNVVHEELKAQFPLELVPFQTRMLFLGRSLDMLPTRDAQGVHCPDGGPMKIALGLRNKVYPFAGNASQVLQMHDEAEAGRMS
tara:strand:- start:747 stop:1079 length:333 start_codon:yes stop_codon:yes gene_type:complete